MGQGTVTGLAQLVAEELECDWSKVTWEYPTPGQNVARNRVWKNFSTGGSRGIRESQEYVREGGAAARIMLIEAAAKEWGVPSGECKAFEGYASRMPPRTARRPMARSPRPLPGWSPRPRSRSRIRRPGPSRASHSGGSTRSTRSMASRVYGFDLKLPGMLNAAIRDCPVFGGKLVSFDAGKIEKMPGVKKVVRVDASTVAVVADHWWQAKTALDALPIVWDEGPNAKISSADIAAVLKEGLTAEQAYVGNQQGRRSRDRQRRRRSSRRLLPIRSRTHACMEPMNAHRRSGLPEEMRGLVPDAEWPSTTFAATVAASGLPAARCDVYKIHLRWRLRPARPVGLCHAGGEHRQARCRASRSSFSGRARRICSTAPITRSRRRASSAGSTRMATSLACICAFPASRSSRGVNPQGFQNGSGSRCLPGSQCRVAPKARSAMPCRTCLSIMRCAIPMCRLASGEASISTENAI